jgi:hexosaminidase
LKNKFSVLLLTIMLSYALLKPGLCDEIIPPIIPKPAAIEVGKAIFHLDKNTQFNYDFSDGEIVEAAEILKKHLQSILGDAWEFNNVNTSNVSSGKISFLKAETGDSLLKGEYQLNIDADEIRIRAGTKEGFFYANTTLRQILMFSHHEGDDFIDIPEMKVSDRPVYPWRGLMLDVARRYLSIDFIKRYIDLLAFYKMNVLHLHLTDDQGWRIQIDRYPKLVSIGSNLKDREGNLNPGYYTKDDIRDIVAYAAARQIMVVPEIEFPGHCVASLNAYPELSCTGGPFEDQSNVGALYKDNYCLGKDEVFKFYYNVLDEVFELFPSRYIHIGGDEAPEIIWSNCDKCQARIQKEGLQGEDGLQSWGISQVNEYIRSKGRTMVGWTEIIKGGLPEGATVQSWTGFDGAITAAEQKQDVIISNGYYFNSLERRANDGLKTVYTSDLLLPGLSEKQRKYIIGGEGCVWESREDRIDQKVLPRLLAMAESFWAEQSQKNYSDFYNRVKRHYPVLEKWGFQAGLEENPITWQQSYSGKDGCIKLFLIPGQDDIQIHYTLSGEDPLKSDPILEDSLSLCQSFDIKAQAFQKDSAIGMVSGLQIERIANHAANVHTEPDPHPNYIGMAREKTLIDGFRGTLRFHDQFWQAFLSTDVLVDLDLGKEQEIHKISVGALHDPGPGIFLPKKAEFFVSDSKGEFQKIGEQDISIDQSFEKYKKDIFIECENIKTGRVKIKLTSFGGLPEWHHMFGNGGTFIFIDEVWVE